VLSPLDGRAHLLAPGEGLWGGPLVPHPVQRGLPVRLLPGRAGGGVTVAPVHFRACASGCRSKANRGVRGRGRQASQTALVAPCTPGTPAAAPDRTRRQRRDRALRDRRCVRGGLAGGQRLLLGVVWETGRGGQHAHPTRAVLPELRHAPKGAVGVSAPPPDALRSAAVTESGSVHPACGVMFTPAQISGVALCPDLPSAAHVCFQCVAAPAALVMIPVICSTHRTPRDVLSRGVGAVSVPATERTAPSGCRFTDRLAAGNATHRFPPGGQPVPLGVKSG